MILNYKNDWIIPLILNDDNTTSYYSSINYNNSNQSIQFIVVYNLFIYLYLFQFIQNSSFIKKHKKTSTIITFISSKYYEITMKWIIKLQ